MAYLIPLNLGSRSDVPNAVQQVATAFRDLVEDDVTVIFDTRMEHASLVVIDPRAGVLFVDVVEGGARGLAEGRIPTLTRRTPTLPDILTALDAEAAAIVDRLSESKHLRREVPVAATHAAPLVARAKARARPRP